MPGLKVPKHFDNLLKSLPAILSGAQRDRFGLRQVFLSTLVFHIMQQVGRAFEEKSDGGTDDLGHSFAPLHRKTIAKKSTPSFRAKHPTLGFPEQIMRASGKLLLSLSEGELIEGQYYPPRNQVVEFANSILRIYSKLPYAVYQAKKRPFVAEDISPWVDEALKKALEAVGRKLGTLR